MNLKKKILITGASGFVGQSCAQALHAAQYDVRLAVRKSSKLNLIPSDFEKIVVEELSSETQWEDALRGCNCVIHTAARVHILKEKSSNPFSEYRRVNVEGTINLAKQAIVAGVTRFIYISSIKVNGETSWVGAPFRADDTPNPKDEYSQSKYEAEEALKQLAIESGLEIVIIRPPLIYGPGVKGNFRTMLGWLQKGFPLPVTKMKNKRSFVGLSNLIDLIELCIDHPKAVNEVFLVSDGHDLSTSELFSRIGENMDKPARLLFIPYGGLSFLLTLIGKKSMLDRLYGSLHVDIEKNERVLGWKPRRDFQEMLAETVHEYLETSNKSSQNKSVE